MSFPPGTEMFQFPGFASAAYGFSGGSPLREGLPHSEILGSKPARGSPRLIAACHVLHRLLAPRHPPDALAFLDPHQRQPQPYETDATAVGGRRFQRLPTKLGLPPAIGRAARIPMPMTSLPADGRPTKGQRRRLADAYRQARQAHACRAAAAGISSPPHDVQGTRPERPPKKGGAGRTGSCRLQAAGSVPGPRGPQAPTRSRQVLVGLGRLERPTSRLSGVRSNQLSYRPEHHPAGPDTRRRGQGHEPRPSPPADPVRRLFAKGRADGGRNDPDGQ